MGFCWGCGDGAFFELRGCVGTLGIEWVRRVGRVMVEIVIGSAGVELAAWRVSGRESPLTGAGLWWWRGGGRNSMCGSMAHGRGSC
jgi:hypothetical protein